MAKKKNKKLVGISQGHLVLDLVQARVPGYVRIAMNNVPFAYFQLRAAEGGWQLGYTNPQGEFVALAFFTDETEAKTMLAQIGKAYMHPHPIVAFTTRAIIIALIAVASLWLLNALLEATSKPTTPFGATSENFVPGAPMEGVPVDADTKLTPPK